MNKYQFYQLQRNKYFELYKAAKTRDAQNECLRILYWYSTELDLAFFHSNVRFENKIFMLKVNNYFLNKLANHQAQLIDSLDKTIKLLEIELERTKSLYRYEYLKRTTK